jgi:Ran GTPase-activating protein (RanGAP) involved in mRNA processing and transport
VCCCSDNYIGALGASVLANALARNRSLRELHLKGNELGNEGVAAVCAALRERQAPIHSLDFGNNKCAGPALPCSGLVPCLPVFLSSCLPVFLSSCLPFVYSCVLWPYASPTP